MSGTRKYWFSQRYKVEDIGGELILMPVVNDLTDRELKMQFAMYIEKEDYEYCDVLKAEAELRGINIWNKKIGK